MFGIFVEAQPFACDFAVADIHAQQQAQVF